MADQRKGIFILLLLSIGVILFFVLSEHNITQKKTTSSLSSSKDTVNRLKEHKVTALERLDLNRCTAEELEALPGIGEKLSHRIIDYRDKMGGFKNLEEVRNIQGIANIWEKVEPYFMVGKTQNTFALASPPIQISEKQDLNLISEESLLEKQILPDDLAHRLIRYRDACKGFKSFDHVAKTHGLTSVFLDRLKQYFYITIQRKKNFPQITPLDLNRADSVSLEQLPGLGPVLSARIIKYRQKLGFYYTLEQLNEVYNLKPEFLDKARPYLFISKDLSSYSHLSINDASAEQLQSHPYLKDWKTARKIIQQRKNKKFTRWQDLYDLEDIDSLKVQKISPYLVFD